MSGTDETFLFVRGSTFNGSLLADSFRPPSLGPPSFGPEASCIVAKPESFSTRHSSKQGFTADEILTAIGTHKTQVFLSLMAAFAYAAFMEQSFLPTLATTSMWEEWPELEERRGYYNWVFAASAIARLIGSLVLIPSQDILGRRAILSICLSITAVFTVVSAACVNFPMYIAVRAGAAFGCSALPAVTTIYVLETVAVKRRALPPTILQIFHVLAIIYVTLCNMAVGYWRWLYLCGLAPIVLALGILIFTRIETPRFYIARGKREAAWRSFLKLSSSQALATVLPIDPQRPLSDYEINGIDENTSTSRLTVSKIIAMNFVKMANVAVDRRYRHSIVTVGLLWAFVAFGYWGATSYMTTFFTYIGLASNRTTLVCFAVQIPGMILTYFQMQSSRWYGGRINSLKLCSLSCAIGLLGLSIILISFDGDHKEGLLFAFSVITYFFSGPLWNVIYLYSTELFPTTHRGSAMALFGTITAVCTLITTFVGSQTITAETIWQFPLVWAAFFIAAFLVTLLLREETRAAPLVDAM